MALQLVADTIEDLMVAFHRAQEDLDEAQRKQALAKERLIEKMVEDRRKSVNLHAPDDQTKRLRATVSFPQRVSVNEGGLKKAIGARAFHKVTTEKVDMTKLNKAVSEGTIDETLVKQNLNVTTSKRLNFTVSDWKEEELLDDGDIED